MLQCFEPSESVSIFKIKTGCVCTGIFCGASETKTGRCGLKQVVERLQVTLLNEVGKRLLAGTQANEGEEDWRSQTVNAVDPH